MTNSRARIWAVSGRSSRVIQWFRKRSRVLFAVRYFAGKRNEVKGKKEEPGGGGEEIEQRTVSLYLIDDY